jgi:hypothetical protein
MWFNYTGKENIGLCIGGPKDGIQRPITRASVSFSNPSAWKAQLLPNNSQSGGFLCFLFLAFATA